MPPEINNDVEQPNEAEEELDAVEVIAQLKANTVPRERYENLKREHADLLKAYANGDQIDVPGAEQTSIEDLRKRFLQPENLSDLEIAQTGLELRRRIMESGGEDPSLAVGSYHQITDADRQSSERTWDVIEQCIERADGDNAVFVAELSRRMNDVQMPRARR